MGILGKIFSGGSGAPQKSGGQLKAIRRLIETGRLPEAGHQLDELLAAPADGKPEVAAELAQVQDDLYRALLAANQLDAALVRAERMARTNPSRFAEWMLMAADKAKSQSRFLELVRQNRSADER